MVRRGHLHSTRVLIAVVEAFLIGCLVLMVGCSGLRSEAPQEKQGHTEASKEQAHTPEATASEEARCEGTRKFKRLEQWSGVMTTNDLPGCPKGGLLTGTDGYDNLAGEDGEDEVRGLGTGDFIFGGAGNDVIYGGPGGDNPLSGDEGDDVIYGGDGDDVELGGDQGADVVYGGDGSDSIYADVSHGDWQRDKLYCGEGRDSYMADKVDYVSSSCEVKMRPSKLKGIP